MSFVHLLDVVFVCAAVPAVLFCWNLLLYREPPAADVGVGPVSVLIPARNEERSIEAAVESVLRSQAVDFEVIVLDDSSDDKTAELVAEIAGRDSRVRLESAPPLPAGWNGKQHACHVLAAMAEYETLCFLDADVRVSPDALIRMAVFMGRSRSALVSGFPLQETRAFLEWLLLPLIHFVLLGYLPLAGMRAFRNAGFAAGCGQFLMVNRDAYRSSGGHASIRTTMHDGLLLPQLLRKHGQRTDIADLTCLATCRMYRSTGEVWQGLAKNATEGIAAPARILPFTFLLLCGQVFPIFLAAWLLLSPFSVGIGHRAIAFGALFASFLPRLIAVVRYRQPFKSALLHPIGITVLLVLQWYALARKLCGQPATWKQRAYTPG